VHKSNHPKVTVRLQEYESTCLLGCETDSYDSEGAIVRLTPWKHVTQEAVEGALAQFRGNIEQTPPMFVPIHKPIILSKHLPLMVHLDSPR
jgi:tRNA U55 pseudouridine synthase TruB